MDSAKKQVIVDSLIAYVKDLPIGLEALQGYWTDDMEEIYNDIQSLEEEGVE